MGNFFVSSDFILEKFKFEDNFKIPSVKNIDAEAVIKIYEAMRGFFPSYQALGKQTTIAPKLENILAGKVITEDVYPLVCNAIESSIDIDHIEDFIFAESLLKLKEWKKTTT